MRCECCEQNEATKTYAKIKGGEKSIGYYCMDCFQRLFISFEESEGASLSACPYCGMTLDEVRAGKIVGCAFCYRTMGAGIYPIIKKMQGDGAHTGEKPPLSPHRDYGDLEHLSNDEKKQIIHDARLEKQCRELETIIEKLKSEDDYEAAKDYAGKLSSMRENLEIEEEFVWRTRPTSKQP